jgi:hypothetical protein
VSESEPDAPTGDLDPLHPELNFRRHPNECARWLARRERRRAETASGPFAAAAAVRPAVAEPQAPKPRFPQPKSFTGAESDVERFLHQLSDFFSLSKIGEDLDRIRTAELLCECRAGGLYDMYLLKIDRNKEMRVLVFRTWERFEASLRDSFGGRLRCEKAVNEWNRLKAT